MGSMGVWRHGLRQGGIGGGISSGRRLRQYRQLRRRLGGPITGLGSAFSGPSAGLGVPVTDVSIFGKYGMFGPTDIFGPLGLFGYNGLYGPQAITFPSVFIAGWWNGYC